MCFLEYYRTVSEDTCGYSCRLEAAADLAGCLRKKIIGSGPLYHPIESGKSFTKPESENAIALAQRASDMHKAKKDSFVEKDFVKLADDLFDFAVGCLISRGAIHKGPPKIS